MKKLMNLVLALGLVLSAMPSYSMLNLGGKKEKKSWSPEAKLKLFGASAFVLGGTGFGYFYRSEIKKVSCHLYKQSPGILFASLAGVGALCVGTALVLRPARNTVKKVKKTTKDAKSYFGAFKKLWKERSFFSAFKSLASGKIFSEAKKEVDEKRMQEEPADIRIYDKQVEIVENHFSDPIKNAVPKNNPNLYRSQILPDTPGLGESTVGLNDSMTETQTREEYEFLEKDIDVD